MRTRLAIFVVLVASIAASVAIAAPDRVTQPFLDEPIQLGIVEGTATLDPNPATGDVMLHAKLSGLDPSTAYELVVWEVGAVGCGAGEIAETIQFESNPAGIANLNRKLAEDISTIGSVSVRFPGAEFSVACADF